MHFLKLCFYSAQMPPSGNTRALHCSAVLLKSCCPDPGFDDVQTCIHSTRGIFCLFIARFMPEMQVGLVGTMAWRTLLSVHLTKRVPGCPPERAGVWMRCYLPPLSMPGFFGWTTIANHQPASTHAMFDNGEWPEPTFDEHRENTHARELGSLEKGDGILC